MVDATVMVVRWAHTKRSIVRKALTQIIISRERFLGIVLNRVDMKKHF
jgi:Mrp family chromosome partitioning ATPase